MWKFFNRVMQSLSKGSIIKLFKEWLYIKVLFYISLWLYAIFLFVDEMALCTYYMSILP